MPPSASWKTRSTAGRGAAQRFDLPLVLLNESDDASRSTRGLVRNRPHLRVRKHVGGGSISVPG
jgi:hypothetical protein